MKLLSLSLLLLLTSYVNAARSNLNSHNKYMDLCINDKLITIRLLATQPVQQDKIQTHITTCNECQSRLTSRLESQKTPDIKLCNAAYTATH